MPTLFVILLYCCLLTPHSWFNFLYRVKLTILNVPSLGQCLQHSVVGAHRNGGKYRVVVVSALISPNCQPEGWSTFIIFTTRCVKAPQTICYRRQSDQVQPLCSRDYSCISNIYSSKPWLLWRVIYAKLMIHKCTLKTWALSLGLMWEALNSAHAPL